MIACVPFMIDRRALIVEVAVLILIVAVSLVFADLEADFLESVSGSLTADADTSFEFRIHGPCALPVVADSPRSASVGTLDKVTNCLLLMGTAFGRERKKADVPCAEAPFKGLFLCRIFKSASVHCIF